MSLPLFSPQSELFSTAALSGTLFAQEDRYRLFAKLIYPQLAAARPQLEPCYCLDNGRTAVEPVLLFGVSLLQELDGLPDRQAVEMLRYHAGWNFALNRQVGDPLFHPTTLVNFRQRLNEHQQSALGFTTILRALEEAGLVSRQTRQRLDSTQMFGRVARMNRLDCVRESLRLALLELEPAVQPEARPLFWVSLWERYVESQADYRAGSDTLLRKLAEAGTDAWQLLQWLGSPALGPLASGTQAKLLARVFGEQFQVVAGAPAVAEEKQVIAPEDPPAQQQEPVSSAAANTPAPPSPLPLFQTQEDKASVVVAEPKSSDQTPALLLQEKPVVVAGDPPAPPQPQAPVAVGTADSAALPSTPALLEAMGDNAPVATTQAKLSAETPSLSPQVQPRDNDGLDSAHVQNPHEPEATYAVKGQGQNKKEHVGYKVQIAETVCEATLDPGEPTRNFLMGILTHPAYESDENGAIRMEQEQAQMGLEKPPVQYVDTAYVSAQILRQAHAEGREIIGPAQPGGRRAGRFSAEDFQVNVEERKALCPAGRTNTQCSRLVEESTGKVSYRFEFGASCHDCPRRRQCLGKDQRHRSLVVGEFHTVLQTRRQEQQTPAFQQRMKHRNAIEGTQSELVRAHGLRQARYRGLAKVRLQNYFMGAACNAKRWIRREIWKLRQAAAARADQVAGATAG